MKFRLAIFLIIINSSFAFGQEIPVYSFQQLEPLLHKTDHNTYVINMWATWCGPCVKEIPVFNQLNEKYKDNNVIFIMVSLDFGKNLEQRVKKFVDLHQIKAQVIILDDPDANSWINKVNENWSGGIPATLIYNKEKRKFYEQSFELKELDDEINKFLKFN